MWSHCARPKVITLTSDYIKRLSLYYQNYLTANYKWANFPKISHCRKTSKCLLFYNRKPGFYYNETEYLKQTFNFNDIFLEHPIMNVSNPSRYSIEELRSPLLGRCYTICRATKQSKEMFIPMRRDNDIKGIFELFY